MVVCVITFVYWSVQVKTQMMAVLIEVSLTGHGDDHGGDDEKGWGDEAEVFHFVGKVVVVCLGLEEEGGSVPGG